MKKIKQLSLLFLLIVMGFPNLILAQLCEPIHSVPKLIQNSSSVNAMEGGQYQLQVSVGQPVWALPTVNNAQDNPVFGFWADYLTEPKPPLVRASDGDFTHKVIVEWDVEGDESGPPVTSDEISLWRNGYLLTTLPMLPAQYQDFNVFPGEYYTYGVTVANDMGESQTDDNVGFLNPNGIITGCITTNSGNPIFDAKVKLTPNLGRSAYFGPEGGNYVYWFDGDINTNHQFSGLENDYTLETWFRALRGDEQQVLFSAVDSASVNHYILLELTDEGKVRWQHSPVAGEAGTEVVTVDPFAGAGSDWHHLSCVYADSNKSMTMYVDGFLVGQETTSGSLGDKMEIVLGKRGPRDYQDYFRQGWLDDFRIWSVPRAWDDVRNMMDITLSGEEDGLVSYFKFDEVEGEVVFDMTNQDLDGKICGVERDDFLAPVYLGALTDLDGDYAIRGIYYADGTIFTVTPSQSTPIGRSLEFDGIDEYLSFSGQRIDLTSGYTLEGWFKTASQSAGTIFSAVNPADDSHRLKIKMDDTGVVIAEHFDSELISNQPHNDNLWHHWAVSFDNYDSEFSLYLDAELQGTTTGSETIPDLSELVIARDAPEVSFGYFDGYLDEMRLWDLVRTAEQISGTMNQTLDGDNFGLANYWRLNDGVGNLTSDATGTVTGTIEADSLDIEDMWTRDIPLNEYFDHWYEPESRQATLNQSNTSVDMVDFVDKSMIPVSGYVRYENTACFQEGVEILLNGDSFIPPIYTDEDGKFTIEVEPGATGQIISCYYRTPGTGAGDIEEELHEFIPPLIELPMVVQPISSLYFSDKTVRKISGAVAGGECKFPITPSQGQIEVTFRSVSGCIEETVVPSEINGAYESPELPPLEYQVTVSHPNPDIEFGGENISLTTESDTTDFIYRAIPEVEFVELPTDDACGEFAVVVKQRQLYDAKFEMFERYGENRCVIQKFELDVFDNITDTTYSASIEGEGIPYIQFTGNNVNLLGDGDHPYQRNIQIVVQDSLGRSASAEFWALIEGDVKIPGVNFSTTTSKMPWYVLRVPPGDESSTFMSTSETICKKTTLSQSNNTSASLENTVHLGSSVTTFAGAGVGAIAGVITEAETTFDIGFNLELDKTTTDIDETCDCLTTSEEYSTSGDGIITGDYATVFIGGGYTVDMGVAQYLSIDGCEVRIDTVITSEQTGVNSTYLHTKFYIENHLMPDLWAMWILNEDEEALADYDYWQEILDMDALAVATAVPSSLLQIGESGEASSSISFDAGAGLTYSYTRENTSSNTSSFVFSNAVELYLATGFEAFGVGWDFSRSFKHTHTDETTESNDTTKTQTIGFVLDDGDQGDGFAFTVKRDLFWDMPVFELIGGQSSCPYEQGTFRIDLPSLSVTPTQQVDIPPDETAYYEMTIGNLSESDDARYYSVRPINATNPDGAYLSINGSDIAGLEYVVYLDPGESVTAQIGIDRGPEEYEYDNIKFQVMAPCDWDNLYSANLWNFAGDTITVSVHFQEPCSESNIANLEDGWLVDGSHGSDTLWVTVNEYNFPVDTFLTSIDLQYRSSSGGDWFTAYSVPADLLIDYWVMMPFYIGEDIIIDGGYELRAQAQCTGGKYPGTSQIVEGLIDRSAPQVLGLPEPVDGILGPDDLIRVTFNEDLQCGEISAGAGDVQLFNTVTSQPVDFEFTCGGNVITIEPQPANVWLENMTFRAELHNLEDVYANQREEPIIWEFYVNRNPIEWNGIGIENIVLNIEDEYSTTRILTNNGGSNRSWEMIGGREGAIASGAPLDLPSWLEVSPTSGTLTPGASQEITISLAEGLDFGDYQTTIYAAGTMGDEPLIVDIRKLCDEPIWAVSPSDYEFSMTFTATLSTDGELSSDEYDWIGVFVDNEIRGVAQLSYVEPLDDMGMHAYEAFLTIYSNQQSGEALSFRVWDASECMELGWIEESYSFEANASVGNLTSPAPITATSQIISQMDYPQGWSWLSLNLTKDDMNLNTIFGDINANSGDIIKSQDSYSQFVNGSGWIGNLTTLNNDEMYMMKISNASTIEMVGYAVDVELDTIDVVSGWNWIGYMPQSSMDVNWALNSLPSATGDIIKSQFGYAQYLEGYGWFGSLTFMSPKQGYMLKSLYSGQLTYPFYDQPVRDIEPPVFAENAPDWSVNASDFEFTMTMTGISVINSVEIDDELDLVGAFVDGECRGIGQPVYIEALEVYAVFLMVYSNDVDGEITFRVFDASVDAIWSTLETQEFATDANIGDVLNPFVWTALPPSGDVNFDGLVNVSDVIRAISFVLGETEPNDIELLTADQNGDNIINVLDVIQIVNIALGIETVKVASSDLEVEIRIQGDKVSIVSENNVYGFQADLFGTESLQSNAESFTFETETSLKMVIISTEGKVLNDGELFIAEGLEGMENIILSDRSGSELSYTIVEIPTDYELSQNYPNPFNPITTIQFGLPEDSEVDLVIYDLLGREVANLVNTNLEAGYHEIHWNGLNAVGQTVSSGVYFYRMTTPQFTEVKKMVLLR